MNACVSNYRRPSLMVLLGASLLWSAIVQSKETPQTAEWELSATERATVDRGDIVISNPASTDRSQVAEADLRAAIIIDASPEKVFRTMTSCAHAMRFVPRIRSCKVLETAEDGTWQVVEHDVAGNGYLPSARYVFRADYERFERIRCTEVSGAFRENRGLWTFRPAPNGAGTLVTYSVHVVPKFYAPRWIVRANLKRELPSLMRSLRDVAQAPPEARVGSSKAPPLARQEDPAPLY